MNIVDRGPCVVGDDLTEILGVTKYEPPDVKPLMIQINKAKRHQHPLFRKYTDINHLKKYWNAFEDGENIVLTEKLHGTNFRCGWVPFEPRTFWQKLKNIFGLNPKWEFVYGSHNVQLMDGGSKVQDAFANNVYKRIVEEHDLKNKIEPNELWYGEIIGHGIQAGYAYGYKEGEVDVFFMDIRNATTGKYVDFDWMVQRVMDEGEEAVPHTWGNYNATKIMETLNEPGLCSFIDFETRPVEGFVVRPLKEATFYGGRKILKVLNDEYLLRKDTTDWH